MPQDQEETNILGEVLSSGGNFFIGISDEETEGQFINVYNNDNITYTNWDIREPNNHKTDRNPMFANGENFVVFKTRGRSRGKWNDCPPDMRNPNHGSMQTVCIGLYEDVKTEEPMSSMFTNVTWIWSASKDADLDLTNNENLEIQMATSGYYDCVDDCVNSPYNEEIEVLSNKLNNAPASFRGNIFKFNSDQSGKVHHFLSTRNNNFSNRAQKGDITVL